MNAGVAMQIEKLFLSLPREERAAIISHGTVLRLSNLRKRLFLAEKARRVAPQGTVVTHWDTDFHRLPLIWGCLGSARAPRRTKGAAATAPTGR